MPRPHPNLIVIWIRDENVSLQDLIVNSQSGHSNIRLCVMYD